MKAFWLDRFRPARVRDLYRMRDRIQLDPDYQRQSDVWGREKRRLLIDSMINQFDVPKLYFRHFATPVAVDGANYEYSVIDGRQRLETIWSFMDDGFALSDDVAYIQDEALAQRLAGLTFSELSLRHPQVANDFLTYELDVVTLEGDEEEIEDLVEDLFLRLNEAVPLNAAEKRNAFGGPIPALYKQLVLHSLFQDRLPFSDRRYRYYDIATKLLYFEARGGATDTKKVWLDRFVRSHHDDPLEAVGAYLDGARTVCDVLAAVFKSSDRLLDTVGMVSVYYLVFKHALSEGWAREISRESLESFHQHRVANRLSAREDEAGADYDLLEFDRFAQSPNDLIALRFRRDVLLEFLGHPVTDEPINAQPAV